MPWNAVKKSWGQRRTDWVKNVEETLDGAALSRLLLMLESALKMETFSNAWTLNREAWRGRVESASTNLPMLEEAVLELEQAIQWDRVLLGPGGQPLTQAQLGSVGVVPSVPLPPPLGDIDPDALTDPPEGVPRSALNVVLLLRTMGVQDYEPR